MCPLNSVCGTGAGPNLLREDKVIPDWMSPFRVCKKLRLRSSTNEKVEVVVTLMLYIGMEETRIRVVFGLIKNLGVPVILDTSSINKLVKVIFPAGRKRVL